MNFLCLHLTWKTFTLLWLTNVNCIFMTNVDYFCELYPICTEYLNYSCHTSKYRNSFILLENHSFISIIQSIVRHIFFGRNIKSPETQCMISSYGFKFPISVIDHDYSWFWKQYRLSSFKLVLSHVRIDPAYCYHNTTNYRDLLPHVLFIKLIRPYDLFKP